MEAAFLAFLLFERGHGLSRSVPGFALAAVLFGSALGVALLHRQRRTRGARRIVVGLVAFVLLCLLSLVQPTSGGWTAALVAAGATVVPSGVRRGPNTGRTLNVISLERIVSWLPFISLTNSLKVYR